MKIQIRRGVFETNSSSVHSLTICSKEEFDKWQNGELLFNRYGECFVESTDKNKEDEDNMTEEQYDDSICNETFHDTYTTKSGDEIVAFGYYGYDS